MLSAITVSTGWPPPSDRAQQDLAAPSHAPSRPSSRPCLFIFLQSRTLVCGCFHLLFVEDAAVCLPPTTHPSHQ